jgi:tetratricopeptide (TPR) repeat protein
MHIYELTRLHPWWPWSNLVPDPPEGMLGGHEALMCYFFAKDAFHDLGVIVDAGSFLGKSAYFFAKGLRANPKYDPQRHRIHCFDNFRVNESSAVEFIRHRFHKEMVFGDSIRALFDSQTVSVREMLEIHAGDFLKITWPPQPIEILFVDIAKTVSLCRRVAQVFFPCLIPGESIVIHQDYHHPWLPHIHVVMEHLADYFELIVPRVDDSAVFRFLAPIPQHVLRRAIDYDFSYDEQLALMDRAISRLAEEDRYYVQLARIVLQSEQASPATLRLEVDELESRFKQRDLRFSQNAYFDQVRDLLVQMEGWRALAEGDFERCLEVADKILAQAPNNLIMTMRGNALNELGRYSEAEEQLRVALALAPRLGYTEIQLAYALAAQSRFGEAEAELLCAMRDPREDITLTDYFEMLAVVWNNENAPGQKVTTMAMLHRQFPDNPEVWLLDARLHQLTGDSESARISLTRASQLGLSTLRFEAAREAMQFEAECDPSQHESTETLEARQGVPAPGGLDQEQ